jgi:hypothetical protein
MSNLVVADIRRHWQRLGIIDVTDLRLSSYPYDNKRSASSRTRIESDSLTAVGSKTPAAKHFGIQAGVETRISGSPANALRISDADMLLVNCTAFS